MQFGSTRKSTILLFGGQTAAHPMDDLWALSIVKVKAPAALHPPPPPIIPFMPRTVFTGGFVLGGLLALIMAALICRHHRRRRKARQDAAEAPPCGPSEETPLLQPE